MPVSILFTDMTSADVERQPPCAAKPSWPDSGPLGWRFVQFLLAFLFVLLSEVVAGAGPAALLLSGPAADGAFAFILNKVLA